MSNKVTSPTELEHAYWVVFSQDRIVSVSGLPEMLLSNWRSLPFAHHYEEDILHIGEHQGIPCFAVDMEREQIDGVSDDNDPMKTFSLRSFFLAGNIDVFNLVARAWQLSLFRRTHRFCGQCGKPMQQVDWELATLCQSCGHRCYPRISPCVIVAIHRDGKILLAQGKAQQERKFFSTLAGFVESGESLEDAVHREVFEEVKIKIKDLEYFGSQPWPFPHSLMMGYLAEYDSGDIEVDGKEILQADWFDLDDLPFVPPNVSIAGQLIEETVKRYKKD